MSFTNKTMIVALTFGGLLGLFVESPSWHLTRGRQKESERQPASVATEQPKPGKPDLMTVSEDIVPHTRKLKNPFAVVIEGDAQPPEANASFTLETHLEGNNLTGKFRYHWELPPGVSLADGAAQDGIFDADQKLVTAFNHHSEKNQILTLRVESVTTIGFLSSGHYHTLDQQRLLNETAEIMGRQKEYLANHSALLKHDH